MQWQKWQEKDFSIYSKKEIENEKLVKISVLAKTFCFLSFI
jgi:hypothetical protein